MKIDAHQVANGIIKELEQAWNSTDGVAFAAPFTEDADFVAIRGDYHRTREAIAHGHQRVFDTIYQASTIRYELLQARSANDELIIAHARNTLDAPAGPVAGEHSATATLVIIHTSGEWKIAAFHNTLVAES